MRVLVIDNYDSFTYNLVHYLEDLNCDVTVIRNDKLTLEEVEPFHKILLSPGPRHSRRGWFTKTDYRKIRPN